MILVFTRHTSLSNRSNRSNRSNFGYHKDSNKLTYFTFKVYDEKVDVYSFGILLWELVNCPHTGNPHNPSTLVSLRILVTLRTIIALRILVTII